MTSEYRTFLRGYERNIFRAARRGGTSLSLPPPPTSPPPKKRLTLRQVTFVLFQRLHFHFKSKKRSLHLCSHLKKKKKQINNICSQIEQPEFQTYLRVACSLTDGVSVSRSGQGERLSRYLRVKWLKSQLIQPLGFPVSITKQSKLNHLHSALILAQLTFKLKEIYIM